MFLDQNNIFREFNDSNRRIVGVLPSPKSCCPFICCENDLSKTKEVENTEKVEKVENSNFSDVNSSDVDNKV